MYSNICRKLSYSTLLNCIFNSKNCKRRMFFHIKRILNSFIKNCICCHKVQLEFICIISGFSKFGAIMRYCCHDECLERCRACFLPCCCHLKLSPLFWKLPTFSFGTSIKKPMEKYNHHPDSQKRVLH